MAMALSDPERSRRFARRRTDDDGPDDSLAELHAELVLLREENARLKAAEHKGPDIDGLLARARSLSAARDDDDGRRRRDDTRARRGPRDPRVAARDLPPDRARDDQLRGPPARAARRRRTPTPALRPPRSPDERGGHWSEPPALNGSGHDGAA